MTNDHVEIQGVSKRLLKVRVSITSIFYEAEDLKFCTNKLQNYTIWYIRWDKPKRHLSINKIVFIFLVDFKKKQNLVANFDKKTDFLCEKHQITILLTGRGFNYPWAAILWSLLS